MSRTLEIFDPRDGRVIPWRPLSARIGDFLAVYPPAAGWQVLIEAQDALSLQPGRQALYQAAIIGGRNPAEVGLPALPTAAPVVFRASLINAEGKAVATASALKDIATYKDWEIGESAARQRLLAALGFGGESSLDADETGDISAQGLSVIVPASPAPTVSVAKPAVPAPAPATAPVPAAPAVDPAPVPPAPATVPPPAAQPASPTALSATVPGVPDAVFRQLANQARLKGVPMPEVTSLAEAKAELQRLFKLQPPAVAS